MSFMGYTPYTPYIRANYEEENFEFPRIIENAITIEDAMAIKNTMTIKNAMTVRNAITIPRINIMPVDLLITMQAILPKNIVLPPTKTYESRDILSIVEEIISCPPEYAIVFPVLSPEYLVWYNTTILNCLLLDDAARAKYIKPGYLDSEICNFFRENIFIMNGLQLTGDGIYIKP